MNTLLNCEDKKIEIAGIKILAKSELPFCFSERCAIFQSDFSKSDVILHLGRMDEAFPMDLKLVCEGDDFTILENGEEIIKVKYSDRKKKEVCWELYHQKDKLDFYEILIAPGWENNLDSLNPLFFFELSEFLIRYDAMILHSSVVDYQGKGIVFTAPSKTGKSTQAELWRTIKGAEILNGDRTILRKSDCYMAYGSPYAGSSGIIRNEKVELTAIVVLRQAKQNSIRRLATKEAYLCLLSEFSVSGWNKNILGNQSEWILQLLQQIPVYRLDCLPNEGAVDVLYNELKIGE